MYNSINRDGTRNCNCPNGYCMANTAYKMADKNGNPLPEPVYNKDGVLVSGYLPMSMVTRGQNQMVDQSNATNLNYKGDKYGVAINK
jgi:hypothetical protein